MFNWNHINPRWPMGKFIKIYFRKTTYGLDENELKMYFPYAPQTYHLHIHFVAISNIEAGSSVEYSYDLDFVIFNLQLCSEYYKLLNIKNEYKLALVSTLNIFPPLT